MITLLATCMLILGFFPAALYVLGRMKDPLNPLIWIGAASYFVAAHQLLTAPATAMAFLPASAYVRYLGVALVSLGGFYGGWIVSARRDRRRAPTPAVLRLPREGFL